MLRFDQITKYFGARTLFQSVSFTVGNGARIGIVGPNGSGKSTLLRIAAGEVEADSGHVSVIPGTRLAYLKQDRADPRSAQSGGERQLAALRAVLDSDADLLLLDEPTNNLDENTAREIEKELRYRHGAILVVSHDRAFLDAIVDRVIELDPLTARATEYGGGWSEYHKKKCDDIDRQWRLYEVQQTKVAQLQNDIQSVKHQAHKTENSTTNDYLRGRSKKVAAKAKARESRLNRMLQTESKIEKPRDLPRLRLDLPETPMQNKLLCELRNVMVAPVLQNVSVDIFGGQRISVTGANGAGKTTLLKLIAGELQHEGDVFRNSGAKLAVVRQFSDHLPPDMQMLEWFAEKTTLTDSASMRTYLHRFLFSGDDVFKQIGRLSFGERVRLQLAALMAESPDLILLDEPTNHLDVDAIASVEQAFQSYRGAMVVVTHDRAFRSNLAPNLNWHVVSGRVEVSTVTGI